MMKLKATQIDMTNGSIPKKMLQFALPLLISGWLQLSFNLADYIVCGFFVGDVAVGAIGDTGSLIALITDLFIGFAVGVNVTMSNAYGANNIEKAKRTIGASALLALVCGLGLAVIGTTMAHTFLTWMKTSPNMIAMSTDYMFIYFLGVPFLLLYNFGSACLRGMGDSFRPFIYLTIGGVLNVVMNIVLVLPPFNMGVKGLALATIFSEAISAALVYVSLFKARGYAGLDWQHLRFFKAETREILRIGVPAGIQNAMFDIANVIIQSDINSFGDATVTGDAAASRINSYVYIGMDAFAQAGVAFVAANSGAKNIDGIKKSVRWAIFYSLAADAILAGLELIIRVPLLNLIIHEGQDVDYYNQAMSVAQLNMYITMGSHLLMAMVDVFACLERGLGESLLPAIVSFVGICVVRLVYIYAFFGQAQFHSMAYLYATYPISWVITALAHGICLLIIKKKKIKSIQDSLATANVTATPAA
jgi:putative MATE family efflux protein